MKAALIVDALDAARNLLAEQAEFTGYGHCRPDNPHDFSPDHESCTEAEIFAHKAACDAYDKGEFTSERMEQLPGSHVLYAPWGIGAYTLRDGAAQAALRKINAALKELGR